MTIASQQSSTGDKAVNRPFLRRPRLLKNSCEQAETRLKLALPPLTFGNLGQSRLVRRGRNRRPVAGAPLDQRTTHTLIVHP